MTWLTEQEYQKILAIVEKHKENDPISWWFDQQEHDNPDDLISFEKLNEILNEKKYFCLMYAFRKTIKKKKITFSKTQLVLLNHRGCESLIIKRHRG